MSDTSKLLLPNTCQVPNVYLDELMPLLSESELKIVLYAVRRTLGFHKRYDPISLTQFMRGQRSKDGAILDNGTGLNRATLVTTLERLVEHGVLIKKGHGKNGDVWEPQLDYAKIDMTWFAARAQEGKRKIKARTVYPLNQARQQKQFNEQTSSSLTSKPKVVYPLNTQNPGNPVETKIGASAPAQAKGSPKDPHPASAMQPQTQRPVAKQKSAKQRDPIEMQFEWAMQNSPDARKIKSARASESAKATCLVVLRILQTPVKDVRTWTAGGQRLHEVCGGDESIIQAAYDRLKQSKKPLTLSDPWSLVDTAVSIVGEARRGEQNGRPSQVQFAPGHMIKLPNGDEVDERELLAQEQP